MKWSNDHGCCYYCKMVMQLSAKLACRMHRIYHQDGVCALALSEAKLRKVGTPTHPHMGCAVGKSTILLGASDQATKQRTAGIDLRADGQVRVVSDEAKKEMELKAQESAARLVSIARLGL